MLILFLEDFFFLSLKYVKGRSAANGKFAEIFHESGGLQRL
jgi:hypothetical protein